MTLLSRSSDHLTHGLTSRLWLRVEWHGILTCPRNLRTHRRPHNPYTGFHNSPGRMCVNQASMETCWFLFCYMPPERSMVRTSVEILSGGSSPRAAFYIPVVQVMEQRSPKPQAAGLSPAGNARLCMTGGRHAESSGASGRESSRCSGAPPFTLSEKLNVYRERCLY